MLTNESNDKQLIDGNQKNNMTDSLLKKALINKNREICMLNRIITNLRSEIKSLSNQVLANSQQIDQLKKTIKELRQKIKQKQQIDVQKLKMEEQLLDKMLNKSEKLQKKQAAPYIQEKDNKQAIIQDLKSKFLELERENARLGMQLQLRSEQQSRVTKNSEKPLSHQQFNQGSLYRYYENRVNGCDRRTEQNPFRGFLKPNTQTFLDISRFSKSRGYPSQRSSPDLTWCKIGDLMSSNAGSKPLKSSRNYNGQAFLKNKSQLDASSAIEMIRQENERIKISLR